MKAKLSLLMLAAFAASSHISQAAVLLNETFDYSDGDLVGNGGWAAHSGAGSTPVQVSSSTAILVQGSGSREDVNVPIGSTIAAGETYYASFDVTITGGSTLVYFAHFKDTSVSGFASRIFLTAPDGSGDFRLGIGEGASITGTYSAGLDFGTTYKVVIGYNYDSATTTLWVDPTSEASSSVTSTSGTATAVSTFALRQAGGNSTQVIDNLVIGTSFADVIPEPSTALLGALGMLGLLRRRR